MKNQIILASQSPRRQQFLRDLGLPFDIVVADIDETPLPNETPVGLVKRLARAKASAVADKIAVADRVPDQGEHLIIAADTIVALGDKLLGKPIDETDAAAMLQRLRNRPHQVRSALSILHTAADPFDRVQRTIVNSTDVSLRDYSDDEIAAYIATGDPLDKAGSYAIQHPGFAPAHNIKGCYSGVMGLSLVDLSTTLAEFGVEVVAQLIPICESHGKFQCCQREIG